MSIIKIGIKWFKYIEYDKILIWIIIFLINLLLTFKSEKNGIDKEKDIINNKAVNKEYGVLE